MSIFYIVLWTLGVLTVLPMALLLVWFFWIGDKMDSELPGWYKWLAGTRFGKGVQRVAEFYLNLFDE